MATKFFTGLPLDGPDPECVKGYGEDALAGTAVAMVPAAGSSDHSWKPVTLGRRPSRAPPATTHVVHDRVPPPFLSAAYLRGAPAGRERTDGVMVDELQLFDEVAETLRALLPADYDDVQMRSRRWGIKVWFGGRDPGREHYEAQVLGSRDVPEATVLAIEVGFHAEHRDPAANEAALAVPDRRGEAVAAEPSGADAVAGVFLGRAEDWRRALRDADRPRPRRPRARHGDRGPPHRLHHHPSTPSAAPDPLTRPSPPPPPAPVLCCTARGPST